MAGRRDPIQEARSSGSDLYDVVDWEPRTALDRLSVRVHSGLRTSFRVIVIALAVLILVSQFLLSGIAAIRSPMLGAYILLSVLPALLLAGYVWKMDVTIREPLDLLVATFALGVLFAGFAAVLNSVFKGFFVAFGAIGLVLFFYLVVAPVEETVKWLAVRLFAYRSSRFHAVVDGAVYGAMAGLGFATIENTIYIVQPYMDAAGVEAGLNEALQTAAVRTFAGPGHVIYSAFAGYYLGLAKFNPENRGPIVVKGLLIAAFIHATYNSIVSNIAAAMNLVPGLDAISPGVVFIAFIFIYDGVFFYILYRKISRYRDTFVSTGAARVYSDGKADDLALDDSAMDESMAATDRHKSTDPSPHTGSSDSTEESTTIDFDDRDGPRDGDDRDRRR